MTTLTSTQDGAHDALYALLSAAGASQSPAVPVYDTFLLPGEIPPTYVILWGTQPSSEYGPEGDPDEDLEIAALGSFAFYEKFTLYGQLRYFSGGIEAAPVRDAAWALFNAVVMGPVVDNHGQNGTPVISSSAPAQLEYIVPTYARYRVVPGNQGGGSSGFQAVIDWAFELQARIVPA